MHSAKILRVVVTLSCVAAAAAAADFSGASALEFTRAVVELGPRPPGSAAAKKTQAYVIAKLKGFGWEVIEDTFTAKTPVGPVAMKNIIARKPGTSGKSLAVTGHYDTKRFPFPFVGANDAGSSTGFLLEMARALSGRTFKNDIYLVFFDGEEAFKEWTSSDSLYGSRHLADKWHADGTLGRMTALVNVDMIGDRDLHIVEEQYSSEALRRLVWQIAAELGHSKSFDGQQIPIEDDHAPFLRKGVRALDLIDFEYGPGHVWWHTKDDTMDKLSAASFQVVGNVLVETLRRLDGR